MYFERKIPSLTVGYFTDITLHRNSHAINAPGLTNFAYAEDNTVMYRVTFTDNMASEPIEPSTFYNVEQSYMRVPGDGDMTVRSNLTYSHLEYPSLTGVLTINSQFNSFIFQAGAFPYPLLFNNNVDLLWLSPAGNQVRQLGMNGNDLNIGPQSQTGPDATAPR